MSGTEDPNAWVSRLLADSDVGPMPADVAARLEQRLARLVSDELGGAARAVAPQVDPFPVDLTGDTTGGGGRTAALSPVPAPAARSALPQDRARRTRPGPAPEVRETSSIPTVGARRGRRQEEASDRRRLLVGRVLPIAASVVVLGAAGAVVASLVGGGDAADSASSADEAASPLEAAAGGDDLPTPPGLVASGTDYTADTVTTQVPALVTGLSARSSAADAPGGAPPDPVAGGELAEEAVGAEGEADTTDPAPEAAPVAGSAEEVESSPLADPAAYSACAATVTDGLADTAVAIDLATFDGLDAAIVVIGSADGRSYDVYVTSRDCSPDGLRDFFSVPR